MRAKTGVKIPSSIVFKPGTDATFGGASLCRTGKFSPHVEIPVRNVEVEIDAMGSTTLI
jgi:hypothetical protein